MSFLNFNRQKPDQAVPARKIHKLPANVQPYKHTQTFTQATTPKGFLKQHSSRAGIWALLCVEKGQLEYVITESGYERTIFLHVGESAVVAPEHKHYVSPSRSCAFHMIYYR
jgi:tellurite resistance-related uncharacterized protein